MGLRTRHAPLEIQLSGGRTPGHSIGSGQGSGSCTLLAPLLSLCHNTTIKRRWVSQVLD